MNSDISKRISDFLAAEQELRERPRHFGLSDAGRSEEQERSCRTIGRLQTRARTPDRARQSIDSRDPD